MPVTFQVRPVGRVRVTDDGPRIVVDPRYREALLGIDGFSHIGVCISEPVDPATVRVPDGV